MTPLFSSHYSFNSILTFEEPSKVKRGGPASIVKICKDFGIKQCFLVEKSFAGFYEARKNLLKESISMQFGLKLMCTQDLSKKDEASLKSQHKVIVFFKNDYGYRKLMKIYSMAATDGFYYVPRIDLSYLESIWDENDLLMAIPFYDSFIYANNFSFSTAIASFGFTKPIFFIERNDLPIDAILEHNVKSHAALCGGKIMMTKSIYYENRNDFRAYMAYRCILNRSVLEKPNMDGLSSDNFCIESLSQSI